LRKKGAYDLEEELFSYDKSPGSGGGSTITQKGKKKLCWRGQRSEEILGGRCASLFNTKADLHLGELLGATFLLLGEERVVSLPCWEFEKGLLPGKILLLPGCSFPL